MPARRRVPLDEGEQALAVCRAAADGAIAGTEPTGDGDEQCQLAVKSATEAINALPREVRATAVRYTLEELAASVPGRSVEVRVPPFG
ncbi:MAG: sterol carrier family protein, partial [Ornithinimicrobium sp.]